ncbi:hypothetical protein HNQ02_003042 [Flavobacterium sp. 7E]|uniref:hypothetical protein n=1 Tax=Flavobacterium sp. 7E TaxID=2735898 RepID=UPI00156DEEA6|nr:hypothetical protein [Flavobacterium sp. 7E]NRS90105.1 hypothetical protein [Flavobacterium sp. 7E]
MGKFYIYNVNIDTTKLKEDDKKYKDATIIFNSSTDFDINSLKNEITEHFREFHQTCALIFIHCSLNKNVNGLIDENLDKIFKSIPIVEEQTLKETIFYVSYNNKNFEETKSPKFLKENFKDIINQGLVNIFIKNGGLVESNGISHHYVFPSGKHSSKFLRTANVLVKKCEIDFVALNTLHKFKNIEIKNIYCDTLSINVIGYSISQYLNRFNYKYELNIESFKSYDAIYNKNTRFLNDSVFLISASTSGGLVHYLKENHGEAVNSNNVCVLYYLPIDKDSQLAKERVLCDLQENKTTKYGLELYDQFKPNEKCKFCENKSTAIKILGDSFSLDEPIINTRNITAAKYITKSLKDFVEIFKHNSETGTALKVSYSEDSNQRKKYDIYIDYENIITNIEKYNKHKEKLDSYINQYTPASLKFIIHLNDKGSELLAQYIYKSIEPNSKNSITIINQANLTEDEISKEESGSILIVGSCITNGKNLLYLSRFFRNYENIRLIYFIGINRISDLDKQKELKSNIKYGLYGPENSSFIEIETINCDNSNSKTPWEIELDYLMEIREGSNSVSDFINNRINLIENISSKSEKGGSKNIFYPNLKSEELEIRKNSAFFNDNKYFNNIKQSDVYFTISCVLNNMRNNKIDGLFQTSFVRNLIDPFIFNRFNDGIIQASILRASKNEELNYSYSLKISEDMFILLKTIIHHKDEYQGEAILEFMYALSIGKLKLHKNHYKLLLKELTNIDNENIKILSTGIQTEYKKCL